MARVILRAGHVRPIFTGHPWVFQQAVARVEGGPGAGDEVAVVDPEGRVLGRGLYSPLSKIPVRLFTQADEPVDAALIRARIAKAVQHRRELELPSEETNGFRLVHGEGDGLPGLIVDLFGDVAVLQLNTHGVRLREAVVLDAISAEIAPRSVLDRTSESAARVEGVPAGAGLVRGEPVELTRFRELGLEYELVPELGQKTGYYFDQRELRRRVQRLARDRSVLDAYTFVGSFAMAAARGGAREVVAVDQSALAIEVAAVNVRKNGLSDRIELIKAEAVRAMESPEHAARFDLVLCDPPKLAPSRGKLEAALGAYRRVARAACRATKPGGLLVLSSCSSALGLSELVRVLAHAAREANLRASILEQHIQAPDHPVPAAFPEGLYLKSVVARIDRMFGA